MRGSMPLAPYCSTHCAQYACTFWPLFRVEAIDNKSLDCRLRISASVICNVACVIDSRFFMFSDGSTRVDASRNGRVQQQQQQQQQEEEAAVDWPSGASRRVTTEGF